MQCRHFLLTACLKPSFRHEWGCKEIGGSMVTWHRLRTAYGPSDIEGIDEFVTLFGSRSKIANFLFGHRRHSRECILLRNYCRASGEIVACPTMYSACRNIISYYRHVLPPVGCQARREKVYHINPK